MERKDIEAEITQLEATYAEFYQLWTETKTQINRLRSICPLDPNIQPIDSLTGKIIEQSKIEEIFTDVKNEHRKLKEKLHATK